MMKGTIVLSKSMQFPAGISIDLLVWLSCRVSYINNNTIGYDINTPLMTMYEIMTLCRHIMVKIEKKELKMIRFGNNTAVKIKNPKKISKNFFFKKQISKKN